MDRKYLPFEFMVINIYIVYCMIKELNEILLVNNPTFTEYENNTAVSDPKAVTMDNYSSSDEEIEVNGNARKRDASNDSDNEEITMKRKKKSKQLLDSDDDD